MLATAKHSTVQTHAIWYAPKGFSPGKTKNQFYGHIIIIIWRRLTFGLKGRKLPPNTTSFSLWKSTNQEFVEKAGNNCKEETKQSVYYTKLLQHGAYDIRKKQERERSNQFQMHVGERWGYNLLQWAERTSWSPRRRKGFFSAFDDPRLRFLEQNRGKKIAKILHVRRLLLTTTAALFLTSSRTRLIGVFSTGQKSAAEIWLHFPLFCVCK